MKVFWAVFGLLSLGLGMIGVVMPLLPTVPFLLLAAFCFARSSEKLHYWLMSHPTLGPPIQQWQQNGAINRGAKRLATLSIGIVFMISLLIGLRWEILVVQAVTLCLVMVFIWSRPNG